MSIEITSFKIVDQSAESLRIILKGSFTSADVAQLREEVTKILKLDTTVVYLDTVGVGEVDLSGINEIIHSHFTLNEAKKQFILLYKKASAIEKWIETTGLDKFVATASLPAA